MTAQTQVSCQVVPLHAASWMERAIWSWEPQYSKDRYDIRFRMQGGHSLIGGRLTSETQMSTGDRRHDCQRLTPQPLAPRVFALLMAAMDTSLPWGSLADRRARWPGSWMGLVCVLFHRVRGPTASLWCSRRAGRALRACHRAPQDACRTPACRPSWRRRAVVKNAIRNVGT